MLTIQSCDGLVPLTDQLLHEKKGKQVQHRKKYFFLPNWNLIETKGQSAF